MFLYSSLPLSTYLIALQQKQKCKAMKVMIIKSDPTDQ